MKKFLLVTSMLLIGFLLGACLVLILSLPRKVGISQIAVSHHIVDGQEVLIVDSPEHPPWAQQHLTSVEFDYDQKTISILRYAVTQNPGLQRSIESRWPVVIGDGLLPGDYTLQFWQGERFAPIGKVVVKGKKIKYLPLAEK
jgi:hypothetical protein